MKLLAFPKQEDSGASRAQVSKVLLANLDSLYSTAHRMTGRADLAEDLVQDAAQKAVQSAPTLRDERNVRAWIFKILMNSIRDHLRHQRLWDEVELAEEIWEASTDPGVLRRATTADVREALTRLAPPLRSVVLLIDVEGLTLAEAADSRLISA